MASPSRSRRAAAGIAFIVAGALFVLVVVLPLLHVNLSWLIVLAEAATAVGLVILAVGAINSTLVQVLLIAAAVGWAVLAIVALGVGLPHLITIIAALLAGIAGLIAAILIQVGKEITNTPALVFIVATALGLLSLLGSVQTIPLGSIAPLVLVLFGAALGVTGYLFRRRERGRR